MATSFIDRVTQATFTLATASTAGLVSTAAQTFAGAKTFNGNVTLNNTNLALGSGTFLTTGTVGGGAATFTSLDAGSGVIQTTGEAYIGAAALGGVTANLELTRTDTATSVSAFDAQLVIHNDDSASSTAGRYSAIDMSVAGSAGATANAVISAEYASAGNANIGFYTDSSNVLGKRLEISSAGNFDFQAGELTTTGRCGFGQAVQSSVAVTAKGTGTSTSTYTLDCKDSAGTSYMYTRDDGNMYLKGDLAINNTSYGAALHVNGATILGTTDMAIDSGWQAVLGVSPVNGQPSAATTLTLVQSESAVQFKLTNGSGTANDYGLYFAYNSACVIQAANRVGDTGNIPDATQYLALNPLGGNVGIGTTSPSTALDVSGAVTLSNADDGRIDSGYVAAGGFADVPDTGSARTIDASGALGLFVVYGKDSTDTYTFVDTIIVYGGGNVAEIDNRTDGGTIGNRTYSKAGSNLNISLATSDGGNYDVTCICLATI